MYLMDETIVRVYVTDGLQEILKIKHLNDIKWEKFLIQNKYVGAGYCHIFIVSIVSLLFPLCT